MIETKTNDRLAFLAEKFDIFEDDKKSYEDKIKGLQELGFDVKSVAKENKKIEPPLALVSTKTQLGGKERLIRKVSTSIEVFTAMIKADPTPNKSCVQWMLNVFTRLVLEGTSESIASAIRFVVEDLPQASEYIILFEGNKRKVKFKDLCKSSYILKHIKDPTDINQYKSLAQLFDAIDPFIEREASDVERLLNRFVDANQAIIPIRDRKFTLYIPKTLEASVAFNGFANWCTTRPGNGMFDSYTNYQTPYGKKSNLYIIINNKFFTGESQELYQIHFESNQIKDRHNSQNVSIFESVMRESEGLSNFFYEELMGMAKACKTGLDNNKYLDFLVKFGFTESVFEIMPKESTTIRIMTREIPRLPDLSDFRALEQLIITNAKLVEVPASIGKLETLELVAFTGNKIKSLPKEIGNLKNLGILNLSGNPLVDIPEEIKYLDKSNGGKLFRIVAKKEDIGEENYQKLKRLLPNATMS